MKLIVNAHKIELIKEQAINEKEINISKCTFEFSEDYGDNLVKEAYFTLDDRTYKQIIVNNECSYPPEILVKEATVELGVVAYEVQDEEYIERFNPSPVYFQVMVGSLKEHAENSEEITPSEMEQFEQALNEGLQEVANVDIDAEKVGNTATVSITNRNGVTKTVEIYDGEQGEDGQPGLTPNIQVGNTTTLPAGSNATVTQRGTLEEPIFDFGIPKGADGDGQVKSVNGQVGDVVIDIPDVSNFITRSVDDLVNYYKKSETYTQSEVNNLIGAIQQFHYEIVQTLPATGANNILYLVPKSESQTSNYYDEYVYANNNWEKIGDTEIDLSNYVTITQLNTALSNYTTTAQLTTLLNAKQDVLESGTNIKTINNESILGSGNIEVRGTHSEYNNVVYHTYCVSSDYQVKHNYFGNYDYIKICINDAYKYYVNNKSNSVVIIFGYGGIKYSDFTIPAPVESGTPTFTFYNETCIDELGNVWRTERRVTYTFTNGKVTGISMGYTHEETLKAIGTQNSTTYTPTSNYHPATKKYVDDSISSAVGDISTALANLVTVEESE